ncbi:DUF6907 domain-containing protein [Streptomyces sp. NPDC085479]|uniref:DUF6907 domain-containing protein n=1 Tax=Streptomyces sp. NPDC085479 TaxID=3365726 RepID=UPI0037D2481E
MSKRKATTDPTASLTAPAAAEQIAANVLANVPGLAARIDADTLADLLVPVLRQHVDKFKPTAAERGAAWMARYGCPILCISNHDSVHSGDGWHQGPAIAVDVLPGEPIQEPKIPLAARIIHHNDEPDTWGVKTEVWLDLGDDTHQLDLAETDRFIARMNAFLPRLKTMRDQLADLSRDDRPADPERVAAWHKDMDARIARVHAEAGE